MPTAANKRYMSPSEAAKALGMPTSSVRERKAAEKRAKAARPIKVATFKV